VRPNWRVLSVYLLGVFLGALDTNVVGPVFPLLMRSFRIPLTWTAWTVTVYTVAYVAATVLAGAWGDRVGHRRVFQWGIVAFGIASLVAALSPNFLVFLLARLIQGSGAGAVYPNAQAEGLRFFPSERKGLALGVFGASFGLASVLGPTLGGALGQYVGWPAVFVINAPLALGVLWLTRRAPPSEVSPRPMPDTVGGVAFAAFLAALLLWVMVQSPWRWALLALALALLALFAERQRREPVPFLDTAPLANVAGVALVGGAAVVGLDMSAAVFVPTLVQRELGFTVLASGLALLPAAFAGAILSGAAGVLTDRIGPRVVLVVGLAAGAAGGVLLAWPGLTLTRFILAMVAFGLGTAFTMGAPLNRIGVALYREDQAGQALALMAVFRSVGLAAGPVLLTAATAIHGFTGMFFAVAAASLVGIFLFLGVPDVRPDRPNPAWSGQ
jgi:MFS family permease